METIGRKAERWKYEGHLSLDFVSLQKTVHHSYCWCQRWAEGRWHREQKMTAPLNNFSIIHCHPFATLRMPHILKSMEVCDFSVICTVFVFKNTNIFLALTNKLYHRLCHFISDVSPSPAYCVPLTDKFSI